MSKAKKQTMVPKKTKTSKCKLTQPADLHNKKSKHEMSQKNSKKSCNKAKQEASSRVKAIKSLCKQQKRKCDDKKSFKSRKRHRQEPVEKQEM